MFIRVEIKAYKRPYKASNHCADTTVPLKTFIARHKSENQIVY